MRESKRRTLSGSPRYKPSTPSFLIKHEKVRARFAYPTRSAYTRANIDVTLKEKGAQRNRMVVLMQSMGPLYTQSWACSRERTTYNIHINKRFVEHLSAASSVLEHFKGIVCILKQCVACWTQWFRRKNLRGSLRSHVVGAQPQT
jgi:hypothetical protein